MKKCHMVPKMMMVLSTLLLLHGCGLEAQTDQINQAEEWNGSNDPSLFSQLGASYEYAIDNLPTQGEATRVPWAGWYWATYRDAINYHWDGTNSDSPTAKYAKAFGLDPQALEDAVSAKSGIDSLSYRTSCTTSNQCDSRIGETCAKRAGQDSGTCIPTWFGQCHAWAPAAVVEPEPINPVTVNGVTFKVQDIKALMTYVYNNVKTDFLGGRCNQNDDDIAFDDYGRPKHVSCRDTNPGALHVIMTNWLGIHGKSFVEDRTWDDEVWNQPIRGYNITQLKEVSENQAAALMNVTGTGGQTDTQSGTVAKDEWQHYGPYSISDGMAKVSLTGSGDADLYVRLDAQPTKSDYDCRPYKSGSEENCSVSGPGEVYVSVHGYAATSDISITIQYGATQDYVFNNKAVAFYHVKADIQYITESNPNQDGNLNEDSFTRSDYVEYILEVDNDDDIIGGEWVNNAPHADFLWVPTSHASNFYVNGFVFEYNKIKDLLNRSIDQDDPLDPDLETTKVQESGSVAKDGWIHFGPYETKSGAEIHLSGNNDADLYVRMNAQPNSSDYDCRPWTAGSDETCSVAGEGQVFVSVYGYAQSDFNLAITYYVTP